MHIFYEEGVYMKKVMDEHQINEQKNSQKNKKILIILGVILAAALVIGGVGFFSQNGFMPKNGPKYAHIDKSYLFADQSQDYMTPLEPTSNENITVRFRSKAGELTGANLHYMEKKSDSQKISSMKRAKKSFYKDNGYDPSKVEFWEGTIPAGKKVIYYYFEAISNKQGKTKKAWISAGAGDDGRGIYDLEPSESGFSVAPNYKTSKWSRESILYQIMVERFRDGDSLNNKDPKDFSKAGEKPEVTKWGGKITNGAETDLIWNNQFFGGDLVGVKEGIPYLKKVLGVNALYFLPIFQSDSDHKYDNDTYDYVDKNFGGNKTLADLGKKLKKENIKYILDGVFNHTSATGSLYTKNKGKLYFQRKIKKGEEGHEYYPWHGYFSFAKLDYSKEATKNYIYKGKDSVAKKYLKAPYYANGWRLDAADDVNTEPGDLYSEKGAKNTQRHIKNNLKVWKDFHDNVRKVNKDCFILGEVWSDGNQWYYGDAWDGRMNYSGFYLPFIEGKYNMDEIISFTRDNIQMIPYNTALSCTNSLSTHDKPRILNQPYCGKDNSKVMKLAQTLQLTYVGIPMIYYGDEIGLIGDHDGNDPYDRQTFNWNSSEWNYDILNNYRYLISARKNNKDAFVYGALEEIMRNKDEHLIVYARYGKKDKAIVMINDGEDEAKKEISLKNLDRYGFKKGDVLIDVLSGNEIKLNGTLIKIPTSGKSASCYVLKDKFTKVKKLDKKFDVKKVLYNYKDTRTKLSKVKDAKLKKDGSKVELTYSLKKEKGQKEVLVRVLNKSEEKLLKDIKVKPDGGNVKLGSIPSDAKVYVKVLSDRDKKVKGIKDVYMDSEYVKADF